MAIGQTRFEPEYPAILLVLLAMQERVQLPCIQNDYTETDSWCIWYLVNLAEEKIRMKTLAICGLLGAACFAQALMIDDFSTGNSTDSISSGLGQTYAPATVPGGNRYVGHSIQVNPLNLTHTAVVTNGIFASDSKTLVDAIAVIGYGSDASGGFTVATDLNLNLSAQNAFKITVLSNDLPADIYIGIRTNSGALTFSAVHAVTPGMVMVTQTITVNFSEFLGQNFADVDTIGLYVDTTASGDMVIDSFEAVPEPASLFALGLGAAALVARKRK